jgi:predicted patatin/cPLA2 family phospholipase
VINMPFMIRFYLTLALLFVLPACGTVRPHMAVPEQSVSKAVVTSFNSEIRSWGDESRSDIAATIEKRVARYKELNSGYYNEYKSYPPMQYLALSGGSNNGAFAAGVLYGWTKAGTRPQFTVVTGVSTGALIAPFAFLGSKYDEILKHEYTTITSDKIFLTDTWTAIKGIAGGVALVDTSPLKKRLDEMITPELFAEIAAEHRKGRRLLIGTTNLEAQRSVIWNIGNIANSGNAKGLELFKKILLASAAVPGIFEPIFIDVTVDGKQYQEIHVDGGVTSQVFLFPLKSSHLDKDAFEEAGIERNLYIIRNGKVSPDYLEMKPMVFSLSQRSIETLIKYQGLGDLYRLYSGAVRDGINYRLAYIPPEFNEKSSEIFDPVYMSKLFQFGHNLNKDGDFWFKVPPGIEYAD